MKIKSHIQKVIALALVVFSLSFVFPSASYAYSFDSGVITEEDFYGELIVPANSEEGVLLENQTGKEVTVAVEAFGKWSVFPTGEENVVGPEGYPTYPTNGLFKFPYFITSSLCATLSDGRGDREVEGGTVFTIAPYGTATFFTNDDTRYYADNRGEVLVFWHTY